jgi:hypothetical protein
MIQKLLFSREIDSAASTGQYAFIRMHFAFMPEHIMSSSERFTAKVASILLLV